MRYEVGDADERERALAYVRSILQSGGPLSRELLIRSAFSDFNIELLVGATVESPEQYDYRHGLTTPTAEERAAGWQPVHAPHEEMRNEIAQTLTVPTGFVWFFEDPLSRRGDLGLQDTQDEHVFLEDGVYSFVGRDSRPEQVDAAFNVPPSWQYIGVLSVLPPGPRLVSGSSVNLEFLRSLASGTTAIVTMIFDGEGYMLLRKS